MVTVLTPIEFRLLAVLLNNAGKGTDATPVVKSGLGTKRRRTQSLSTYLYGTTCQKLEQDPARPRVAVETGIGYRFMP